MNAARPLAKLVDSAVTANTTLPSVPSKATQRATQRYCISTLCNVARGDDVEQLMRRELLTPGICIHHIERKVDSRCKVVRIVAVVACAGRARMVLFWLVNRLGLDPDVRLVRWETMAPVLAANVQPLSDAKVPRSSLAGTGSPKMRSAARK